MTNFSKIIKYAHFRIPTKGTKCSPTYTPALSRWIYCCRAILEDVRQKRHLWRWETIRQARLDRRRYVDLYIKKKKNSLVNVEIQECQRLEEELDYESQLFCRKVGLKFLQKDREYKDERKR
jgi:vacuolar protein sorting-associated protein 13A/C